PAPDLSGRVAVVTGANRGIGRATALGIARTGARVVLVCRRVEDGEAAAHAIGAATGNAALEVEPCDLAVRARVATAAAAIAARHPALHVLVNNAGVAQKVRTLSPDGVELTVAVNHLAYMQLTLGLLGSLCGGAPARIVNVSSRAHERERLDLDDLELARNYGGVRQYCRSKLMNVAFTAELARRLEGTGITANALHPGVIGTRLLVEYFPRPLQPLVARFTGTPEEGADTSVWLATSPEVAGVSGRYFVRRRAVPANPQALDPEVAGRLWEWSAARLGLPADVPPRRAVP
ncbi:MAG: SDR family NAD(P)-dependent oxidoreductase, partial [Gemmatimonadales bacterium]|nr:SDR family NAD(P)-dependent oxidoreductase [Gemmatimonadales bacterium]